MSAGAAFFGNSPRHAVHPVAVVTQESAQSGR